MADEYRDLSNTVINALTTAQTALHAVPSNCKSPRHPTIVAEVGYGLVALTNISYMVGQLSKENEILKARLDAYEKERQ
jgi:hypothetical protein